ncbi:MAG: transporter [Herminiimonas sp.]|nr:transporter [Herminiimonas sp.]
MRAALTPTIPATTLALLLTLAALHPSAADAAEEDAITPYRPSVSSPAQLPVPGQLEFEFGGLHIKSGGQRRDSLPYQFKLAFTPQWGLLIGGEAGVSLRDSSVGSSRVRGLGDTSVVLKRAFLIDDATAFGLELGIKIPTARDAIGSGGTDVGLNGIFSRDLGSVHMDANLNVTHVGAIDPGTAPLQTGLSASFSHPLSERWSVTGELSGLRRSGTPSTAQALVALGYSPSKRMTLDIGLIRGLNPASPDLAVFAGIVVPLARLW